MNFLEVRSTYNDPEKRELEIVERKGVGHPDSLADALAELVSIAYSKYCLENFGVVLHHNLDKLYIGGGHFKIGFGESEMLKPVKVVVNGRVSDSFAGRRFDIAGLQRKTILPYLLSVLPHLKKEEIVIDCNSTQHTKVPYWFSPRGKEDLPEFQKPMANDTSVCVSHWPMTTVERLALSIEKHFWSPKNGFPVPRFKHFGQDIKVMVCRKGKEIEAVVCLPVISTAITSLEEYDGYIKEAEKELNILAGKIIRGADCSVSVKVNPHQRIYMLGIGSCIECGEEGLVGRGNTNSGVISIFRPHSVEAWAGKNPVYHTGKVMSFLTKNVARAVYQKLSAKCTVTVLTKNGHSLVPPYLLSIETDREINRKDLESVVSHHFIDVDYLGALLTKKWLR